MTPTAEKTETLRIEKTVFDLDSKSEVSLVKTAPFEGIKTIAEFNERLGSDHKRILEVLNKGLKEFESEKLAENTEFPWKIGEKNEKGEVEYSDFTGSPISPEMSEKLDKVVLAQAAMWFGYAKEMLPGSAEEKKSDSWIKSNREAKKEAKQKALEMILSAPGAIERLKSAN